MVWKSRFRELYNRKCERDNRAYTQMEISEAIDLRQPTISAWMQYGATFAYLESNVVGKLAKWLDVDPRDVVEWVEGEPDEGQPAAVAAG